MTILNTSFSQVTADIVRKSGTMVGTIEDLVLGSTPGPYREIRMTVAIGNPITDRFEVTMVVRDKAFEEFDLFGKGKSPSAEPI